MDLLSQAVLGGCAAQAVMGHRLPRSAWLIGCCAGLLPDADVLLRFPSDPLNGLLWHRHFTHALALAPLLAMLVASAAALFRAWRERFGAVYLASLAATLTHAPLDAATSYGTHLWWPLTGHRTSWDLLPILDPVVTLPATLLLIVSAWWTWRTRLSLQSARGQRVLAILGIGWFIAYAGLGYAQHERARSMQASLAQARGHELIEGRQRVMPQPLSLLLWRSVYEYRNPSTGRIAIATDFLRLPHWPYTTSLFAATEPEVLEGRSVEKLVRDTLMVHPEIDRAADVRIAETFDAFAFFCDDFVALSSERPLVVGDMRYAFGPESRPLWGLMVPTRSVIGSELTMVQGAGGTRGSDEMSRRVDEMWEVLTGRDPRLRPLDIPPQ